MRTDTGLSDEFLGSNEWERTRYDQTLFYGKYSFSGHERNHLFMNQGGTQFSDVAPLSGLDTDSDSRTFVYLDYDRDGWQDIALVNANAPLFTLYRNQIGSTVDEQPGVIAVRFVGGNSGASQSPGFTPRDGYGAIIEATLADGTTLKREHRCGEGFAGQNSATIVIGIGQADSVEQVTVRWPSGKTQRIDIVAEGTLLTAHEREQDSPSGEPFTREPYRSSSPRMAGDNRPRLDLVAADSANQPKVKLYMAMATWCVSCKGAEPHLKDLRRTYSADQLQMVGVPIDPNDTEAKLVAYVEANHPPFELLETLTPEQRTQFTTALAAGSAHSTPATILTDAQGRIIKTMKGVPTRSDIAKALYETGGGP